jgi:hypothetical protein
MCHSQRWQEWERLMDEERREDEEPRVIEVAAEPEAVEPEPERDPERELVHAGTCEPAGRRARRLKPLRKLDDLRANQIPGPGV